MTEVKFEELIEDEKANVMEFFIELLELGEITLEVKEDAEHHLYIIVDDAVAGWKTATMFSSGVAMKWAPVALDIVSGKPLDLLEDGEALPIPAEVVATKTAASGKSLALGGVGPLKVEWVDRGFFEPHPQQPRKHFCPVKLAELRANMLQYGCTPAISSLLARPHPTKTGGLQIISGERKYRATADMPGEFWERQARLAGEAYEGQERLPVVIMEMPDNDALEMMHIANLDREDLTPMEEAHSYQAMLSLPAADGGVNSVAKLAAKLGRSERTILRMLSLLSLPAAVAKAVDDGKLPVSHAQALVRVPAADAEKLLPRILNPETGDGMMSVAVLEKVISTEIMRELRGADFDLEDPTLLADMGACVTPAAGHGNAADFVPAKFCEFNTAGDGETSRGKPSFCRNPGCFARKREATHLRWASGMQGAGAVPLTFAECEQIFVAHNGKVLDYKSGYVELGDCPADSDLTDAAPDPVPKWKALVKDRGVTVYLARDKAGAVHELLIHTEAIAAARENGHDFFRGKRAAKVEPAPEHEPVLEGETVRTIAKPRESEEERAKRVRAEAREIEREKREEVAFLREIFARICSEKRPGADLFAMIVEPIAKLGPLMQESSFVPSAEAMGYAADELGREPKNVCKWLQTHATTVPHEHALAVSLLVAGGLTIDDEREDWLKRLGGLAGVKRKDVEKKVAAEMADEDRRDAEAAEIANGMTWSDNRNSPGDFLWSAENKAEGGTLCALAMPAKTKAEVYITLAKSDKGWHVGYGLAVGSKWRLISLCSCVETSYTERKLALVQGILALIEAIDAAEKWGPPVIERLNAYVGILQGEGTTKGAKSAKKKGGN